MFDFEDIEVTLDDGRLFMCRGELEFEYEPAEPDEPWGYWGATPGHGASANDIEITEVYADHYDDDDNLHVATEAEYKEIKELLVVYYTDKNWLITESYEESKYHHI